MGWDESRDAERIFRVDRMEKVQVKTAAPATAAYEMPTKWVLESYWDRPAWELGEVVETTQGLFRFRFPASIWAARNAYGAQVGEAHDGGTLRQFDVRQPDAFTRWILSQEGDAFIESPPALQEAFRTMARQVADLCQGDADA